MSDEHGPWYKVFLYDDDKPIIIRGHRKEFEEIQQSYNPYNIWDDLWALKYFGSENFFRVGNGLPDEEYKVYIYDNLPIPPSEIL